MPYYIQMLEARDSIHVPDGLEYHGTDLDIKNHSTDTAGRNLQPRSPITCGCEF